MKRYNVNLLTYPKQLHCITVEGKGPQQSKRVLKTPKSYYKVCQSTFDRYEYYKG